MQVHYANVDLFANGETDNSGIVLNGQNEEYDEYFLNRYAKLFILYMFFNRLSHLAGVYLLATAGFVRKNSIGKYFTFFKRIVLLIEMININKKF